MDGSMVRVGDHVTYHDVDGGHGVTFFHPEEVPPEMNGVITEIIGPTRFSHGNILFSVTYENNHQCTIHYFPDDFEIGTLSFFKPNYETAWMDIWLPEKRESDGP